MPGHNSSQPATTRSERRSRSGGRTRSSAIRARSGNAISDLHPGAGPAQVLADAVAALRDLGDTLWSARSDDELVDVVAQVQQLLSAAAAVEAGAVVEVDARGLAKDTLHYGSTGDWLTHLGGLRRGEGAQRVRHAHALCGPLSRTRCGLLAGTVSPAQAEVIVRSVEDLPAGDWVRRRGEKVLLRQAGHLNASELAHAGRHVVEVVDPDGVDRRLEAALERDERAAHLGRFLAISEDRAGGVRIRGRGSAEDGALLKAALLPLTSPDPTVDPQSGEAYADPRDHGTRMWDALVTTAHHALATDLPPETHGTPARLLVTVDHDTLRRPDRGRDHCRRHRPPTRRTPPAGLRRRDHPRRPRHPGEVLDVGRLRRLVTPAIWTALVIRDRHCTFPGCTRPPLMCHAHHLPHWADGGDTSLDNLALLCGHHHRVIHHTPWEIRLNPTDRRPEFKPPPPRYRTRMDPISTPSRITVSRLRSTDESGWPRGGRRCAASTPARADTIRLRPSSGIGSTHAAAVRPDRRGGAPVGPALGRRAGDARGHLADARAAAGARPARRDPQAARADVRPLRGAGAALLLLARLAAAGQDGRAAPGAPDVGHLDRAPAGGRRAGRAPAASRRRPGGAGRDHRRRARAGRGGDRRPGRRRLRARGARPTTELGELSALLAPVRRAAGDFAGDA